MIVAVKRLVAAFAVVLAGALSACAKSNGATNGVAPTGSVAPADAVTGTARDQQAYLFGVRATAKATYPDKPLIAFADLTCSWLAEGADVTWAGRNLITYVKDYGGNVDDAATIMAAAVVNLCPKYTDELKSAK